MHEMFKYLTHKIIVVEIITNFIKNNKILNEHITI